MWVTKAWHSWATRSLTIGALATVLDITIGLFCLHWLGQSTRVGAMSGVAVGAAFTFFANRHFAFKEHNPKLAKPALKFLLATGVAMAVHGQFVVFMRDGVGIPFVLAKVVADLAVFSVGQLFVLRYLVFPRAKPTDEGAEPAFMDSLRQDAAPTLALPSGDGSAAGGR